MVNPVVGFPLRKRLRPAPETNFSGSEAFVPHVRLPVVDVAGGVPVVD
jgi:hypothetical protein